MSNPVQRYTGSQRVNHWFVALLFVLAGLSGLALFHPSLFFFSNLFGGGTWTRILHPFLGVLMFLGFLALFFRFAGDNVLNKGDKEWRRNACKLLRGDHSGNTQTGKYNYGQKMMFWLMTLCMLALVITGFMFWGPWFARYFSVDMQRVAVLIHAISAFVLIMGIIVHVYAAIWVKGSVRAMTRGTVSAAWARAHHPVWYKKVSK
jgi:formate dehydrogenase subunit gamma